MDCWNLWVHVQTQWRGAGFGVIGLDYCAVKLVADVIGIEVDQYIMKGIMLLESKTLAKQKEDMKNG